MPVLLAYPSSTDKLSAHQNFSPGAAPTSPTEVIVLSVPVDPKDFMAWTLKRGDTDYARFVVRSNVNIQFRLLSADVYRLSHDADGKIERITFQSSPYPWGADDGRTGTLDEEYEYENERFPPGALRTKITNALDSSHADYNNWTDPRGFHISQWDVSRVTDMNGMFNGASEFNQDISGWDVGEVTNMDYMFKDASSFNGDLSAWNVWQVTNMINMFWGATSFNNGSNAYAPTVLSWNVSKVTDMQGM